VFYDSVKVVPRAKMSVRSSAWLGSTQGIERFVFSDERPSSLILLSGPRRRSWKSHGFVFGSASRSSED
jgi:hypothetical protein